MALKEKPETKYLDRGGKEVVSIEQDMSKMIIITSTVRFYEKRVKRLPTIVNRRLAFRPMVTWGVLYDITMTWSRNCD